MPSSEQIQQELLQSNQFMAYNQHVNQYLGRQYAGAMAPYAYGMQSPGNAMPFVNPATIPQGPGYPIAPVSMAQLSTLKFPMQGLHMNPAYANAPLTNPIGHIHFTEAMGNWMGQTANNVASGAIMGAGALAMGAGAIKATKRGLAGEIGHLGFSAWMLKSTLGNPYLLAGTAAFKAGEWMYQGGKEYNYWNNALAKQASLGYMPLLGEQGRHNLASRLPDLFENMSYQNGFLLRSKKELGQTFLQASKQGLFNSTTGTDAIPAIKKLTETLNKVGKLIGVNMPEALKYYAKMRDTNMGVKGFEGMYGMATGLGKNIPEGLAAGFAQLQSSQSMYRALGYSPDMIQKLSTGAVTRSADLGMQVKSGYIGKNELWNLTGKTGIAGAKSLEQLEQQTAMNAFRRNPALAKVLLAGGANLQTGTWNPVTTSDVGTLTDRIHSNITASKGGAAWLMRRQQITTNALYQHPLEFFNAAYNVYDEQLNKKFPHLSEEKRDLFFYRKFNMTPEQIGKMRILGLQEKYRNKDYLKEYGAYETETRKYEQHFKEATSIGARIGKWWDKGWSGIERPFHHAGIAIDKWGNKILEDEAHKMFGFAPPEFRTKDFKNTAEHSPDINLQNLRNKYSNIGVDELSYAAQERVTGVSKEFLKKIHEDRLLYFNSKGVLTKDLGLFPERHITDKAKIGDYLDRMYRTKDTTMHIPGAMYNRATQLLNGNYDFSSEQVKKGLIKDLNTAKTQLRNILPKNIRDTLPENSSPETIDKYEKIFNMYNKEGEVTVKEVQDVFGKDTQITPIDITEAHNTLQKKAPKLFKRIKTLRKDYLYFTKYDKPLQKILNTAKDYTDELNKVFLGMSIPGIGEISPSEDYFGELSPKAEDERSKITNIYNTANRGDIIGTEKGINKLSPKMQKKFLNFGKISPTNLLYVSSKKQAAIDAMDIDKLKKETEQAFYAATTGDMRSFSNTVLQGKLDQLEKQNPKYKDEIESIRNAKDKNKTALETMMKKLLNEIGGRDTATVLKSVVNSGFSAFNVVIKDASDKEGKKLWIPKNKG